MNQFTLAYELLIVLLSAFIGGIIAKKLRLPLLVGYILTGLVSGSIIKTYIPYGGNLQNIAEIGVALLLFTLGLEFTLQKLKELGEIIMFASFIQILIIIIFGIIIFPFLGFDFYEALFLGSIASLSSTVIAVKIISDRGELQTLHGELSCGWLFMQDIYTLPLLIILTTLGKINTTSTFQLSSLFALFQSILIAALAFISVFFIGRTIIPKVIEKIADLRSRELLLISAIIICLAFASFFQMIGFSFALGAFLAGILLSSSSAHHGIFAEVRPLKDLFSVVFFVTLSFMMQSEVIFSSWSLILAIVLIIMLVKFLVTVFITLFLGFHTKTAFLVGFSIASVGEFSFIMALAAYQSGLISSTFYSLIIAICLFSLIISVPLQAYSAVIYYILRFNMSKYLKPINEYFISFEKNKNIKEQLLTNHVVVLGYGRVGKYICQALALAAIPYIVIDYNHHLVKKLRETGTFVIYGDPAEIDVLRFANIVSAKVLILAYADRHTMETIVTNALTLNPDIRFLCRCHYEEDKKKLISLGVEAVYQPEFEAAIAISEKLLTVYNIERQEINKKITQIKIEHG